MRELKPILDDGAPDELVLIPADSTATSIAEYEAAVGSPDAAYVYRVPLDEKLRDFLTEHYAFGSAPAALADDTSAAESSEASDSEAQAAAADATSPATASASTEPVEPKKITTFEEPKVILRPREIQDRIRAGESVDDLVEFSGMQRKKIESFAYPVLAERARIAELGKQSRPRRQDGPTKLTLWEILATAFAARGQELSDATWDAYRDHTGQWIVTVTWSVGHTENTAEWSYQAEGSSALTVARNNLAAELVDPDIARRTRDLSPAQEESESSAEPTHTSAQASLPNAWQRDWVDRNQQRGVGAEESEEFDEDFLQHPDEDPHAKRRKKTVMPSWEDVLLGVRPSDRKK